MKPTVGFMLPWAGVTPAPSERNRKMARTPFCSEVLAEEAVANYLAQVRVLRSAPLTTRLSRFVAGEAAPKERVRGELYGRGGRRAQPPVGEGSGPHHKSSAAHFFLSLHPCVILERSEESRFLLRPQIRNPENLVPHPPRADARRPPPTDVGGNPPLLIGRCGSGFGAGARLLFLASTFLQNFIFPDD